jgi:hypothetical protein
MLYLLFQHLCPANPEFAVATATDHCGSDVNLTSVDDVTTHLDVLVVYVLPELGQLLILWKYYNSDSND